MSSHTDYYFITIAQTGNLNQAAQQLYVSQSSLSKYIRRLEESLGVPLFDHSVAPLRLNEAGKLYLAYLQDAQERKEVLQAQLDEISHQERGTLRLGIPIFSAQHFLPTILPRFSRRYPHVKIQLAEEAGENLESRLIDKEVDLAILHMPIEDPALEYRFLLMDRILLVMHRNPEQEDEIQPGNPEAFQDFQWILPLRSQKMGKIVDGYLSTVSFSPRIYLRSKSSALRLKLAKQENFVSFITETAFMGMSSSLKKQLAFYTLPDEAMNHWRINGAFRKGYLLKPYEQFFLQLFQEFKIDE
ncbi:LysR family transcriptional regulator [Acidaminococcus massiliensis]|jgi:DNA-binding transcriptional LysR family regulator|uniref:LysR family transcriptional regulator n=1 Tax=Acidaminococcus massiliensis TaxID=1852375 RepID=UPI00094F039C|nr:LysR family transcriptional regulator [Acidaminococcus massiliensis]